MTRRNSPQTKPKILFLCNYYLPGYKAGGGLRTIVHTVERFRNRFDFRIITLDHDGDNAPYETVKIGDWNTVAGAQVYYLPSNQISFSKLRELIGEVAPDAIYINSVFSILSIYLLILKKLKLVKETPIIIAPEGELSDGALQLKAFKKKSFIKFAKTAGLYRNLIWKVTAEPEKVESERFMSDEGEVFIAPNMPSKFIFEEYDQASKPPKQTGSAKMIFLSRYARKKNFKWLVDNLKNVKEKLEIDVYGPIEDEIYWSETQSSIEALSPNIKVIYKGETAHEAVLPLMFQYHFFVLPTLGENFGHVFVEALAAGCPLLVSDRTPWIGLEEKQIGWDLPLENPAAWNEKINFCIALDQSSYAKLSTNARNFATRWLTDPAIEEATLTVLNYALSKSSTNES